MVPQALTALATGNRLPGRPDTSFPSCLLLLVLAWPRSQRCGQGTPVRTRKDHAASHRLRRAVVRRVLAGGSLLSERLGPSSGKAQALARTLRWRARARRIVVIEDNDDGRDVLVVALGLLGGDVRRSDVARGNGSGPQRPARPRLGRHRAAGHRRLRGRATLAEPTRPRCPARRADRLRAGDRSA
jgi:hypothetical protein